MTRTILLLFILLLWSSAHHSVAQKPPKVYQDLEKHYNENNFEACVKLESQVEAFAATRKDTLAANSYFYLGDAFNQLGQLQKAIVFWEKEKTLLGELDVKDKYEEGEFNFKEEYSTKLYYLSDLYLQIGNYQKAGEMADQLIKADRKLYKP